LQKNPRRSRVFYRLFKSVGAGLGREGHAAYLQIHRGVGIGRKRGSYGKKY
jgi:hypothetical protein